ncbi:MAG: ribonuclease D [Sphingomonadales bacterium]
MTETDLNITPICETSELEDLCGRLEEAPFVTIDTEFMREKTYFSKLCLIQVGGPDEARVIDPLSDDLELAPFWRLLNNSAPVKVVHSARQDFEIFYHATGALPTPVFDTQVAAMVLGFSDSIGYQALVEHYCDKKLDKSSRFTDWARRPLSDKQLHYALGDVTYLRDIYTAMQEDLESNGRASWLAEEMAILTAEDTYRVVPEDSWKRLKHRSRDPKFLGVLQALAAWRETTAQTVNIPRGRLLSDDAILQIAAQKPGSTDELEKTRGVSAGFAQGKHGKTVLKVLGDAEPLDEADLPPRKDRSVLRSHPVGDLLRLLLKARAKEAGVAPKLIASADDMDRFANQPETDLPFLSGWRQDVFGSEAKAMIEGRLALTASGKNIEIVEIDE